MGHFNLKSLCDVDVITHFDPLLNAFSHCLLFLLASYSSVLFRCEDGVLFLEDWIGW